MEKIFDKGLEMDPMSLILGIPSRNITTSAGKRLYNVLTFAARNNILLHWISDKGLSVTCWCKVIYELVPLKYLSILHTKTDQFYKVWRPF